MKKELEKLGMQPSNMTPSPVVTRTASKVETSATPKLVFKKKSEERVRLVHFYRMVKPERISDIEALLDKVDGEYGKLWSRLEKRYGEAPPMLPSNMVRAKASAKLYNCRLVLPQVWALRRKSLPRRECPMKFKNPRTHQRLRLRLGASTLNRRQAIYTSAENWS